MYRFTIEELAIKISIWFVLLLYVKTSLKCNLGDIMATAEPTPSTSGTMETKSEEVMIIFLLERQTINSQLRIEGGVGESFQCNICRVVLDRRYRRLN